MKSEFEPFVSNSDFFPKYQMTVEPFAPARALSSELQFAIKEIAATAAIIEITEERRQSHG